MHTVSRTVLLLAVLGACSRDATSPDRPLPRSAALARGGSDVGAVFTLSNSVAGNAVIAFDRSADGTLTPAGTFATQGNGTGAGLGSQGAVGLSGDGQFLFAVNAASNRLHRLRSTARASRVSSTVASGGTLPISLTTHGNLVYVLNAGGTENITGFSVDANGSLTALPGSSRLLSGTGVGPAEVGFDPSGSWLVVTEKNTNRIDVFAVGSGGYASAPVVNPSAGQTPFGFAFNQHGVLIVSEAFGGASTPAPCPRTRWAPTARSTSSARPCRRPRPRRVGSPSRTMASSHTRPTRGARPSRAIEVDKASLSILDAGGKTGNTGTTPIDAAVSRNSQFLYTLTAGSHEISAFSVRQNDGSLTTGGRGVWSARRYCGSRGAVE